MVNKSIFLILIFLSTSYIGLTQDSQDPATIWAKSKLATMSLEEKIGQLFMIRAHSDLGSDHIKSVEVEEFPELGMEAVWKINVVDFPAFILVDDKGNDFFAGIAACVACAPK